MYEFFMYVSDLWCRFDKDKLILSEKEEPRCSPTTRGGRASRRTSPSPPLARPTERINTTLDLDTVLGEAVASARFLSGARYGVVATVDEEGAPLDPVFSGLDAVAHGFRQSFRDHAAERTQTPHVVMEAALAQALRNQGRGHLRVQ